MVHIKVNILRSEFVCHRALVLRSEQTSNDPWEVRFRRRCAFRPVLHKEAMGRRSKTRVRISILISSTSTDCVLFAVMLRFMNAKHRKDHLQASYDDQAMKLGVRPAPSIYPKLAFNSIHMRIISYCLCHLACPARFSSVCYDTST